MKRTIKELREIADTIQCSEFFTCPGSDVNKIHNMKTCANCAAVIKLKRVVKKLACSRFLNIKIIDYQ